VINICLKWEKKLIENFTINYIAGLMAAMAIILSQPEYSIKSIPLVIGILITYFIGIILCVRYNHYKKKYKRGKKLT